MRTTLDIEDPVLAELKAIQKKERITLGALVSRLLAQAIAAPRRRSEPFAWKAKPMRSRVDLSDKDALYALLDEETRI